MERLEQKHSDRSEDIVFNDVDANTPISLKKAIFLEGSRKHPGDAVLSHLYGAMNTYTS